MSILAREGLRTHFVDKVAVDDSIAIGDTRTAICGTEWEVSVVDPDRLENLPVCYGCIEERLNRVREEETRLSVELALHDLDLTD